MAWTQNYNPLSSPVLSTIAAILPILILLGSLAFFRIRAYSAAFFGLGGAVLLALFVYKMPAQQVAAAALYGAAYGFLPFNCISKYLTNLQINDQKNIANIGYGINEYYLGNWIHSLSVVRNICAHYGYLYKREYTVPISFGYDSKKYINQENGLFGIFYCIRKLSTKDRWHEFISGIYDRIGEMLLIEHYNFPSDLSSFLD